MTMSIKKIKLAAAVGVMFSMSTPAHAVCDGCVVGAVNTMSAAVVSSVAGAATSISAVILTAQQAIVTAIATGSQMQADSTVKSAQIQSETAVTSQRQIEVQKQDSRFAVPDACAVTASSRGVQDAGRTAIGQGGGMGRGGGGGKSRAGSNDALNKALDISRGSVPPPTVEVQAGLAGKGACSAFVSSGANAVRATSCTRAGFGPGLSNGHPDADIRAETLFDGPQKSDSAKGFRRRLTINPDSAEQTAMEAYMRNLNTPFEARQLSQAELQTEAGRKYLAFKDVYEARMSAAEYPTRALAANKIANPGLRTVIEQLVQSDVSGAYVKNYLTENAPAWQSRGISMAEMINLEGERRYLNRDWHLKMASLPPEAHVKEQTSMLAYQVFLMSRVDEKLDKLASVMGNLAGAQVRTEMTPQLNELHRQASR
jgi:hypothetical protein